MGRIEELKQQDPRVRMYWVLSKKNPQESGRLRRTNLSVPTGSRGSGPSATLWSQCSLPSELPLGVGLKQLGPEDRPPKCGRAMCLASYYPRSPRETHRAEGLTLPCPILNSGSWQGRYLLQCTPESTHHSIRSDEGFSDSIRFPGKWSVRGMLCSV